MKIHNPAALVLVTLLSVAATLPAQPAPARPQTSNFLANYGAAMEDLAQAASPAVVQILVHSLAPVQKGGSQNAGFVSEQQGTGSGVIVDPSGYLVTNAHVVQNARRIDVRIMRRDSKAEDPEGRLIPAKLVGLDRQVDLAVLKIEGDSFPALSFMDSDKLRQGQLVLALGSPLGLQNSLTHGVVSATLRQLNPESPVGYIQTDAPINPGNSGGPLLDTAGRIAGINTMIFTESGGNEGIGFAIPSNLVKDVYQRIRKDGKVRRGVIGVIPETITPRMAASLGLDRDSGVILSDVSPHGAAEAAGLEPGDVVLSIDGKPTRQVRDFMLAIFQQLPGSEVKLEIQRGRERLSKTVAVVERKSSPGQLEDLATYESNLVRELGVLAVTLDERVNAIIPNLRRLAGVAIAAIPAEYAALNPGLIEGDIIYTMNNVPIASLEELRAALKSKKSGDPLTFHVERSGQLIYVTAALE